MAHRWHFFRAGGVDQVSLRDGKDLLALAELDQKLWVALAMPVHGVDIDAQTLTLIDLDNDGRIRVQDVLTTVAWIKDTFKNPDDILRSADAIKLSQISDAKIVAAAKQMLKDLGKPDATAISVADATAITKAFADTVLNGDGVVIPASTDDTELRKVIEDAIATVGSVQDRSGKPGVDNALSDAFFAQVDVRATWLRRGSAPELAPLGAGTAPAYDAWMAIGDKLDDYFTRCRIAAFDPRGAAALGGQDAELVALSTRALSTNDAELARLPLSRVEPVARLNLKTGLNPAWAARVQAFVDAAVTPVLGPREVLTPADFSAITERLAPYGAWRAEEPTTKVHALDVAWIERLAGTELRTQLHELIAKDSALSGEYDQISNVAKAVRLQRDGGRIFRNFVNFSDFYGKQDGVFQAGTLYLDARAIHLCVPVADAGKHASLATSSDSFLIYCDISRKGVTRQIAAALTNGDADNVFIGRNGVFYDRAGDDWDATIVKVVSNPISVREAFWTPYKKLVKTIEDNVTRRAAAADAAATAKLEAVGKSIAHADKTVIEPAAVPVVAPEAKKIDLGTVAAIGVAIGGIGTLFGALLAAMFGLGPWLPLGVIAILFLISGPSIALAWLKLRRRNIGPILDANGWAINGRARINVAFGAALTELAKLPRGAQRTLDDPYAEKKSWWRLWVFLVVLVLLAGAWYVGKLDTYLPQRMTSVEVLGDNAPAAKKAKAEAATPAPAPAPSPAK